MRDDEDWTSRKISYITTIFLRLFDTEADTFFYLGAQIPFRVHGLFLLFHVVYKADDLVHNFIDSFSCFGWNLTIRYLLFPTPFTRSFAWDNLGQIGFISHNNNIRIETLTFLHEFQPFFTIFEWSGRSGIINDNSTLSILDIWAD